MRVTDRQDRARHRSTRTGEPAHRRGGRGGRAAADGLHGLPQPAEPPSSCSPDVAIDRALAATARSTRSIPDIKAAAVEAMAKEYATKAEAMRGIANRITDGYRKDQPEVSRNAQRGKIDRAVAATQDDLRPNDLPGDEGEAGRPTRTTSATSTSPGCMRCHDGKHASASGVAGDPRLQPPATPSSPRAAASATPRRRPPERPPLRASRGHRRRVAVRPAATSATRACSRRRSRAILSAAGFRGPAVCISTRRGRCVLGIPLARAGAFGATRCPRPPGAGDGSAIRPVGRYSNHPRLTRTDFGQSSCGRRLEDRWRSVPLLPSQELCPVSSRTSTFRSGVRRSRRAGFAGVVGGGEPERDVGGARGPCSEKRNARRHRMFAALNASERRTHAADCGSRPTRRRYAGPAAHDRVSGDLGVPPLVVAARGLAAGRTPVSSG